MIDAVAAHFEVPSVDLLSSRRDRLSVEARFIAMWICRRAFRLSLNQIGTQFGYRDHSTVFHACRAIELRTRADAAFSGCLARLQAAIEDKLATDAHQG